MTYPTSAKVGDKIYKINTDFRVAIKCSEVINDETINDYERFLAIIYLLYGDEGLKDRENHIELMEKASQYLSCGKQKENQNNEKPDMDYVQDEGLIRSSFQYDYKYDPYEMEYCHWYKFSNDLNNLSNSEMGNCCVLNRVRQIRNYDINKVKDAKERDKLQKAKDYYALKTHEKPREFTEEEIKNMEEYDRLMGGG